MSLLFLRHILKLAILVNGLWKQRKKSLVEQLKGVVALINPFQLCGWHALYFSPFPFSFPRIAVLGSAPRGTCYVTQLSIRRLRKGFLYVLMSSRMQESVEMSEWKAGCLKRLTVKEWSMAKPPRTVSSRCGSVSWLLNSWSVTGTNGGTGLMCRKANLLIPGWCQGKCSRFGSTKWREWAANVQRTQTPWRLAGKGCYRQSEGEACKLHDQLWASFWLVGGEVTEWCLKNLNDESLIPTILGSICWWSRAAKFFRLMGILSICKTTQGYGSGYYL